MKKLFFYLSLLFLGMLSSCGNDEEEYLLVTRLEPVFGELKMTKVVHDGDSIVMTSKEPSGLMSLSAGNDYLVNPLCSYEGETPVHTSIWDVVMREADFHWLRFKAITDSTFLFVIRRDNPVDTVKTITAEFNAFNPVTGGCTTLTLKYQ